MFIQKLNPLTGEADWVLVNDPGLGDEDDASADLVATSSYLDMLTDARRNTAYHAALRRVIPAKKKLAAAASADSGGAAVGSGNDSSSPSPSSGSSSGGGVRVLDIGTGTGLLAMMAARALAAPEDPVPAAAAADAGADADAPPSAPVIACEVFPPMQNLARRVIASNGLGGFIRVVNKRSDEIVVRQPGDADASASAVAAAKQAAASASAAAAARAARAAAAAAAVTGAAAGPDMVGRADVIVTEIFDSELLGEGMIPTMRHAVQHLLRDGGVVIPATSKVYGQVVQCPLMHHMTGLRAAQLTGNEQPGCGSSGVWAAASAAATTVAVSADRVLSALSELDARARASSFSSKDLYEVREMHVDLLYQHAKAGSHQPAATHGLASSSPSQAPPPRPHSQHPSPPQEQPQKRSEASGEGEGPEAEPLLQPLSEPFLVFDFDWLLPPPPSGRRTVVEVPVSADGSAHAVLLWWQLGMTPSQHDTASTTGEGLSAAAAAAQAPGAANAASSGSKTSLSERVQQQPQPVSGPVSAAAPPLLLSTAPVWLGGRAEAGGDGGPLDGAEQRWRDHWKQCWAQLADDALSVQRGDVLRLSFEHDDLNIRSKLATAGGPIAGRVQPPAVVAAAQAVAPAAAVTEAAAAEVLAGNGSAKDRLAALQAEVEEAALTQLMPLVSWLGPLALLQLGDRDRLRTFAAALQAALGEAQAAEVAEAAGGGCGGAEVVVVDGSMALGLLAACHPAVASVTLLQEDRLASQHWLRAAARQLGLPPAKIKTVRSETYFKRLRAGAAGAVAAAASAGPLVLVSEPYFSEFEQLVPWAHLKFWRDYDVIRGSAAARGGRRLAAFPRRARLVAVAAALPELWRTRHALGDVEGLDLSVANAVLGVVGATDGGDDQRRQGEPGRRVNGGGGGDDDHVWVGPDDGDGSCSGGSLDAPGGGKCGGRQPLPILPYAVWQAGGGYVELSPRRQLLSLECGGHLEDVEGAATLTATHGSTCHAIVLWLEYDLGPQAEAAKVGDSGDGSGGLVMGTAPAADGGPTATVQGVYLLRQPVELTRGSRLHVAAQFDGLDADVSVEVAVLPPLEP